MVPFAYSGPASLGQLFSSGWAKDHFYFIVVAIAPHLTPQQLLFLLQLGVPKSSLGHLIVRCMLQMAYRL